MSRKARQLVVYFTVFCLLVSGCAATSPPAPATGKYRVEVDLDLLADGYVARARHGRWHGWSPQRIHITTLDEQAFWTKVVAFGVVCGSRHLIGIDESSGEVLIVSHVEIDQALKPSRVPPDLEERRRKEILTPLTEEEITGPAAPAPKGEEEPETRHRGGAGGWKEGVFWILFYPVLATTVPFLEAQEQARLRGLEAAHEESLARFRIDYELQVLRYARGALRQGDTASAYWLLEKSMASEHEEVRGKIRQFMEQHPELQERARQTIPTDPSVESIDTYGYARRKYMYDLYMSCREKGAPLPEY